MTGNILKASSQTTTKTKTNKNWKKRENPVVSAGVIQSLKHQKRCRRMQKSGVSSDLDTLEYSAFLT